MPCPVVVRVAAVLVAVCLAGCSGAGGNGTANASSNATAAPEWWRQSAHPDYPADGWLVAVGSGTTPTDADASARAGLAAVFRSDIRAWSSRVDTQIVQQTGPDAALVRETSVSLERLEAMTDATLRGVAIARRAEARGHQYSLAVLERRPFADQVAADVRRGMAAFDEHMNAATTALAADRLLPALRELLRRQAQLTELVVLNGQIAVAQAGVSPVAGLAQRTARLARQLAAAGQQLRIGLLVDGAAIDQSGRSTPVDTGAARSAIRAAFGRTDPPLQIVDAPGLDLTRDAFDRLALAAKAEAAAPARLVVVVHCRSRFSSHFRSLQVYRTEWSATVVDTATGDVLPAAIAGSGGTSRPHAEPAMAAMFSLREIVPDLATALVAALAGQPD